MTETEAGEERRQMVRGVSRVLAIQNFGSSGSKFFHALLDNHPNLLTIPSLYMMYFYTRFWPQDERRERKKVIEDFIQNHTYWFDPRGYAPWGTNTMGPDRSESVHVAEEDFRKNLSLVLGDADSIKRKLFIQAVYVAYALSYGRTLNLRGEDYVIVFPYHGTRQDTVVELTKDFPDTHFLYIWREPVQALGSSYKIALTRWGGFVNTAVIKKGYTSAYYALAFFLTDHYVADRIPYKMHSYSPVLPGYASRSKAIHLEGLVKNPRAVLLKFCRWIGIPWSDALLQGTYNGKLWWNRPESARVTGFSQEPLARKHDDIFSRLDRFRLNLLMENLKKGMGYANGAGSQKPPNLFILLSFLLPFKFELIDILPTLRTLPRTKLFFQEFPNNFKRLVRQRKLRGIRIFSTLNEIKRFLANWLLLMPARSYILCRRMLFHTWRNRFTPLEFVERL